ncbi:MAG: choice-of-anchor tandem repeat GloVer-containing protein [Minisyncoccia bacterium]
MKKSILRLATILLLTVNCLLPNFSFGQYTKLHDFNGTTGNQPFGSLISDGTFLYGMTEYGGTNSAGAIFKIKPNGTGYSKLLNFYSTNGSYPSGDLISDGTFLFGMTEYGGANNFGTIFKIMPDGSGYTNLLDFDGTTNGKYPTSSLISDGTFLYGMTGKGGINGKGVVFKIKPDGTGYSKLLDFSGTANGSSPLGSLISDGVFLYGMTHDGGSSDYGVLFKIDSNGTGFTKLLDFTNTNGMYPYGSLISDGVFLYGMTSVGGANSMGVIFKIKLDGTGYSKLFDFSGGASGKVPNSSLISDGTFLYGMTQYGGTSDNGVIFKIKQDGTGFSKLLNFAGATNGQYPTGSFVKNGTFLYGMTGQGGTNNKGIIFKYNPYCTAIIFNQTNVIAGDSSLTVGTHTYTTSGTYTDVFRAVSTCDSIVTTILNVLATTQSTTICSGQSLTIGTHTYTTSGTYHDTLTSFVYGLDSTVTTHLSVLAITQSRTICPGLNITVGNHIYNTTGTYQDTLTSIVYGCDSTVTTHLTVLSDSVSSSSQTVTICSGQSLTIGTATYTTTGTYTYHFTGGACDSAVITNLTVLPANNSIQWPSICYGQSVAVGSHIYVTTGTYYDTLTSFYGCDSLVTTHLTVLSGSVASTTQTFALCAGESVTVGTATYSTSGTFTYHFIGGGCDSAVITQLTIFPASSSLTQNPTVCFGQSLIVGNHTYTTTGTYLDTLTSFHGCDSIVATHLTVLSDSVSSSSQTLTICSGQSVSVGTATYTTSGTYTYHFIGGGCDSVVTTYLTVNNISVSVSGGIFTASASPATYQWISCSNGNTPLEQQSGQSFTANTNGNYAVIIIQNGLACTSTCHNITNVGIAENSLTADVNIYPNPFTSQTTIAFAQEQKNTFIKIMDVLGKEVKTINFSGKELIIEKEGMQEGIYFLQIIDVNKKVLNKKVIIQ